MMPRMPQRLRLPRRLPRPIMAEPAASVQARVLALIAISDRSACRFDMELGAVARLDVLVSTVISWVFTVV